MSASEIEDLTMGYWTDQAYEDAQRADYARWRASLTWREYLAWLWSRWSAFAAGVAVGAVVFGAVILSFENLV